MRTPTRRWRLGRSGRRGGARRRARQRGVPRGDLRHRYVDQLAAAAAQRLPHRARRFESAQRVSDRVAAEHRSVGGSADQPACDRGVVAECRALRLITIALDAQPDSSPPGGQVVGAQLAPSQRCGAGALDDNVCGREQLPQRVVAEIDRIGELSEVHPIEKSRLAAARAVGSARAFHLDDDGARASEQLSAERPRPQRRQIGHQQAVGPSRSGGAMAGPHRRRLRGDFAQPGYCDIQQLAPCHHGFG
jgi:hypothetical protein